MPEQSLRDVASGPDSAPSASGKIEQRALGKLRAVAIRRESRLLKLSPRGAVTSPPTARVNCSGEGEVQ